MALLFPPSSRALIPPDEILISANPGGSSTFKLPRLPYSVVLFHPTTAAELLGYCFRLVHGIGSSIILAFAPFPIKSGLKLRSSRSGRIRPRLSHSCRMQPSNLGHDMQVRNGQAQSWTQLEGHTVKLRGSKHSFPDVKDALGRYLSDTQRTLDEELAARRCPVPGYDIDGRQTIPVELLRMLPPAFG